jgi:6-phosphogluconolactonase
MSTPEVFVVRDRQLLLEAAAARLVTTLVDRIAAGTRATVLVSPDGMVGDLLSLVANGRASHAVEWRSVQIWWSNGAYPTAAPIVQQCVDTLRRLGVPDINMHLVPVPVTSSERPEDTADRYADRLRAATTAADHSLVPGFDLAILSVNDDGSVAGLYPERPSAYATGAVAVDRVARQITLTSTAISAAGEVWLLASGSAAATGTHLALTGAGRVQVPTTDVRGVFRTLVLADQQAAGRIPSDLRRIASP